MRFHALSAGHFPGVAGSMPKKPLPVMAMRPPFLHLQHRPRLGSPLRLQKTRPIDPEPRDRFSAFCTNLHPNHGRQPSAPCPFHLAECLPYPFDPGLRNPARRPISGSESGSPLIHSGQLIPGRPQDFFFLWKGVRHADGSARSATGGVGRTERSGKAELL